MRNLTFLVFILLSYTCSYAQGITYSDFTVIEIDSKASISWVIDSGSICQGVKLEHSLDSVNFTVIDQVIGVCGSSGEAKSYNLIDELPEKNAVNFYRLVFGVSQRSEVISVYVRYVVPGEIQVFPMPAESDFSIYFSNPSHALTSMKIFNESGLKVYEKEAISDDYVDLNNSAFIKGIYYVRFISENKQESLGKFVIQ